MAFFTHNGRIKYSSKKDISKARRYSDIEEGIDYLKNIIRKIQCFNYNYAAGLDHEIDQNIDKWNKELKDDTAPYIIELEDEIIRLKNEYSDHIEVLDAQLQSVTIAIRKKFNDTEDIKWSTFFDALDEYNLYVDILASHFCNVDYSTPQTLTIKKRTKGKLTRILKSIHQENTDNSHLGNDLKFRKVLRLLSCYKDRPDSKLITDFRH